MHTVEENGFYKKLGRRIRELRGTLSQEQLAKSVGLTRTSFVNIEAGRQKLLVHHLFAVAEALGIQPSDILIPLQNEARPLAEVEVRGAGTNTEVAARWVERTLSKASIKVKP